MNDIQLSQLVEDFRAQKKEGSYWDFKREYHHNKAELLLDIICMANNQEDRDAYIIFGIEDHTMQIIGVEHDTNRKNLAQLTQFINGKKFAVYKPEINIQTITLEEHEIDILTVYNTSHTPYYLEQTFHDECEIGQKGEKQKKAVTIQAGVIYLRLNDTKAGVDKAAPYGCIEHLWRKRFGIDKSVSERYLTLLDNYDDWECDFGNKQYSYNKTFPEFQIRSDEMIPAWMPAAAFYTNPKMYESSLKLMYHTTVIYETELWAFDEFRKYLPKAKNALLPQHKNFWYSYYDLSSLEGKLLKILTRGSLNISSREPNYNQLLIFKNNQERTSFEEFFTEHFDQINDSNMRDKYRYQIQLDTEENGGGLIYSAFQVAKAAFAYEKWKAIR